MPEPRLLAIDPAPQPALVELDGVRRRARVDPADEPQGAGRDPAARTSSSSMGTTTTSPSARSSARSAIARTAAELPLLLFHDVCWPHGRRDDYFDAELDPGGGPPPGGRARRVGWSPPSQACATGGLPYPRSAAREGGPGNGVLTAIEDFVASREELRLVVVPAFFGFGAVWHRAAPYDDELRRILDPWDRNPILERLEASRVHHLATAHVRQLSCGRSRSAARASRSPAAPPGVECLLSGRVAVEAARPRGRSPGPVGGLQGRDPPDAGGS